MSYSGERKDKSKYIIGSDIINDFDICGNLKGEDKIFLSELVKKLLKQTGHSIENKYMFDFFDQKIVERRILNYN